MFSHLHFDWGVKRLVMPSAQSYHHRHRLFICECSKNARVRVGGGGLLQYRVWIGKIGSKGKKKLSATCF